MNWKHLFGVKTDQEVSSEVEAEPTIKNARKALQRAKALVGDADDILDEYQELEDLRLRKKKA